MSVLLGAFVFSSYIVYDTHVVMKHLSAEEYVTAVPNLYLDFIYFLVQIMAFLNKLRTSQKYIYFIFLFLFIYIYPSIY